MFSILASMKLFYTIIVCLALSVFAQDNFQRFSVLPFGAYTEETKIQYGAVFVYAVKISAGAALE